MNEKESRAFDLGALVVGCVYSFLTILSFLYIHFFGYDFLVLLSIILVMTGVNLLILKDLFKKNETRKI